MDLCQKGNARIQSFNVKVTRQEQKPQVETVASSKANREKLEAKFRVALNSMYEAFEETYTFEQSDIVVELRDHLVNPAIAHMVNLFLSSRCRTCYRGRQQDAAWKRSRFHTLLPSHLSVSALGQPERYSTSDGS